MEDLAFRNPQDILQKPLIHLNGIALSSLRRRRVGKDLLQQRLTIPHATLGFPCQHQQGTFGDAQRLRPGNLSKATGNFVHRYTPEVESLASGTNGFRQAMSFRGG